MAESRLLITGAAGYLGRCFLRRLATRPELRIVASDLVVPNDIEGPWRWASADIRDESIERLIEDFRPHTVVHLAAVVDPGANRQLAFDVDVGGGERVLEACSQNSVRRLVVTSSGAAYGYRSDHPRWIDEDTPLRAERDFAYAWHKRLFEDKLAAARRTYPGLEQVILRPGTVLGEGVRTPVTRLFERRFLLRLKGGDDRFVFVWDQDVAAALEHALDGPPGIYNLAGDGCLDILEIAHRLGKRALTVPPGVVTAGLVAGRALGLTSYGREQVRFLRYRPVLANQRLKDTFGFQPAKSSTEAFESYASGTCK